MVLFNCRRFCFVGFLVLAESPVWARFADTDADRIDQEELLNSETYSDALSYRFPWAWDRLWAIKGLGYRVSEGSLNANKFLVRENLKLTSPRDEPISISYQRSRYEDLLEQRTEEELRLREDLTAPIYVAMLADGGHFKKYGDLGLAVGVAEPNRGWGEIYYAAVDLYYNQKEDKPGNRYAKSPISWGTRGTWTTGSATTLTWDVVWDAPLLWERNSVGDRYEYQRTLTAGTWSQQCSPDLSLAFAASYEDKSEARTWLNMDFSKSLRRQVAENEASLFWKLSQSLETHVGVDRIDRIAHYSYTGSARDPEVEEGTPSPNSARREWLPFALLQTWVSDNLRHGFLGGISASYAELRENEVSRFSNEVKGQLGYEYRMSENCSTFWSSNWDLDRLYLEARNQDRAFRPWDGGNIQFLMTF